MRLAYAALLFALLVLRKSPEEEPPLRWRPWPRELCQERSWLCRLRRTFPWQPDLSWAAQAPGASCLAGLALALLALLLERSAASLLASLRAPPARSGPCSETETARRRDRRPSRKSSLGRQLSTSGFQSYDQPSEGQRRSLVAFEGTGIGRPGEFFYAEYRSSSSSSSSTHRSPPERTSSPSPPLSPSSSASFCLSRLKSLDLVRASGGPSSSGCSLEATVGWARGARPQPQSSRSQSRSSGSYCSTPHEASFPEEDGLFLPAEETPAPPQGSPLLPATSSEPEGVPLSLRLREAQTQTSFVGLNLVQSSAYRGKGRVLLVEKSLQVQLLPAYLPRLQPPGPTLVLAGDAGKRRKPATLSSGALPAPRRSDQTRPVVSLCGLLAALQKPAPRGSSPRRERAGLFAGPSSPEGFFAPAPSALARVDVEATRDFLEFHVKKKLVQWKCGVPSLVAKSVAAFQPPRQDQAAGDRGKPEETLTLEAVKRVSLAVRICPGAGVALGTFSLQAALRPKDPSVLGSRDPGELGRLAFHTAVKALEVKMGAFPQVVGGSFQLFGGPPEKPLPKALQCGNKVPRAKPPLLAFLPQESVCILDLNILRKWLASRGRFSLVYTRLAATLVTSVSPRRSRGAPEGGDPRERVAQLLATVWRQLQVVPIWRQRLPLPPPAAPPSTSAAAPPTCGAEGRFHGGLWKTAVAVQAPADPRGRPEEGRLLHLGAPRSLPLPALLDSPALAAFPSRGAGEGPGAQFPGGLLQDLVALQAAAAAAAPREEGGTLVCLGSRHILPLPPQTPESPASSSSSSSSSASLSAEGSLGVAQLPGGSLQAVVAERVPAAEQAGAEGGGEGRQEEPPERGPRQRAALPPPLLGPAAASRNGLRFRAEASIVRSSLFMQLELKKEKLNLHFTKKLRAQLRPSQGAGLEVTVGPRRSSSSSSRRRRSSAGAPPPPPPQSRSGAPGRSFCCYVCMPAEPTGARLKTVCWAPPAWILEMNGYRRPQVARLARPARPAAATPPRPPRR